MPTLVPLHPREHSKPTSFPGTVQNNPTQKQARTLCLQVAPTLGENFRPTPRSGISQPRLQHPERGTAASPTTPQGFRKQARCPLARLPGPGSTFPGNTIPAPARTKLPGPRTPLQGKPPASTASGRHGPAPRQNQLSRPASPARPLTPPTRASLI